MSINNNQNHFSQQDEQFEDILNANGKVIGRKPKISSNNNTEQNPSNICSEEQTASETDNNQLINSSEEEVDFSIFLPIIIVFAIVLIGIGIATGFFAFVWNAINNVIRVVLSIAVILGVIYIAGEVENSDSYKRGKTKRQEHKARKQQKRKQKQNDFGVMDAMMMSYAMSQNNNSKSVRNNNVSSNNTQQRSSAPIEDPNKKYRERKQLEQDAYWHRQRANECYNGSLDQQYHDNIANQSQWKANNTPYR